MNHFDKIVDNTINTTDNLGEVMKDSIKAYNNFVKRYFEYCKEITDIIVKSVNVDNIPVNKNTGTISTDFFNGFVSGYETAKNDIIINKEIDNKEPANFYL